MDGSVLGLRLVNPHTVGVLGALFPGNSGPVRSSYNLPTIPGGFGRNTLIEIRTAWLASSVDIVSPGSEPGRPGAWTPQGAFARGVGFWSLDGVWFFATLTAAKKVPDR